MWCGAKELLGSRLRRGLTNVHVLFHKSIMAYSAEALSNYVLDFADFRQREVTNLWLNKTLFFLHAIYLRIHNKPLIKNDFEAWKFGPVLRVVYGQFKKFGEKPIKNCRAKRLNPMDGCYHISKPNLTEADRKFISDWLDVYLDINASHLVAISHERGSAWDLVWQSADEGVVPGMKISNDLILKSFSLFQDNRLDSRPKC
jgi:uncharacterized phage-associated protein